jgi:hypothetical protein
VRVLETGLVTAARDRVLALGEVPRHARELGAALQEEQHGRDESEHDDAQQGESHRSVPPLAGS